MFEYRPPRSRRGGRPRTSSAERLRAALARAAERAARERAAMERHAAETAALERRLARAGGALVRTVRSAELRSSVERASGMRWPEELDRPELMGLVLEFAKRG